MEELISLISVISKNKVKKIDVIGNPRSSKNQSQQLYELIADGKIAEDEQIASFFFPDNENSAFYATRLKKKLSSRLLNTLFFIDLNQPTLNDYNKAYLSAYKQAAAIKILIAYSARKAAVPLAEKILTKALEFDLTDIVVMLTQELCLHYATIDGDKQKFEHYRELTKKYEPILLAEYLALRYYSSLRIHFTRAKGTRVEIVEEAASYSKELENLTSQYDSYKLNYLYYLIDSIRYEITNEYEKLLEVCKRALIYFDRKKSMVPSTVVFSFTLRKFVCYTQLKRYDEAWSIIYDCLKLTREGTNNWFLTLEYAIILSFHSERFQEAYKFYKMGVENPEQVKIPKNMLERWRIYEGYTFFFISNKQIKPDHNNPLKKFRITKFVNELPIYAKDKRGVNISIILIQILFLLEQKRFGDIIDRMESLKTYVHRYLRQDDTFRSNCFIKMLLTLPECSFHKKAVIRKSEKNFQKLIEKPLNMANQIAEIEIVPYEMLWEFVLESLDEKWH